jgi:hypothetical protein
VKSPQSRFFIGRGLGTERRNAVSDEILAFIFKSSKNAIKTLK